MAARARPADATRVLLSAPMRVVRLAMLFALLDIARADAGAPPQAVAIGGVEVTGTMVTEPVTAAVTDAVRTGLGIPNPGPKAPAVSSCVTAACLTAAAAAASADRVAAVTVERTSELEFTITVVIADAQGRALRRRSAPCDGCAVVDATDKITLLVSEAANAVTDDSVAVEVATTPVPGPIAIDGVDRGRAPWSGSLPAGSHRFTSGTVEKELFVEATGATLQVELALPIAPGGGGGGRRFGVLTYAAAGAGALALGTGVVLLARDGGQTCDHPSCPEVYDTATLGWIGVGAGVIGLGAAGYMFWSDRRAERPVIGVVPTDGGAAAFATGRF